MKKIATAVLAVSFLFPMITFAAPGFGGDLPCIAWTTAMPAGAVTYNGQGICTGPDDTNKRLYNLETAVGTLTSDNSALQAQVSALQNRPASVSAPVVVQQQAQAPDPQIAATAVRVTNLETRMTAVEKMQTFLQNSVTTALNSVNDSLTKLLAMLKKL